MKDCRSTEGNGNAKPDVPCCEVSVESDELGRRKVKRRRVFKSGQLIFGFLGSTVDCQILDESPQGLLVKTSIRVPVPDQLAIRLDGGATFHVIRRWAIGTEIGLEFVGPQVIDKATRLRMHSIRFILDEHGLPAAIKILRAERFFDNAVLRQAAEDASSAMAKLTSLLEDETLNER